MVSEPRRVLVIEDNLDAAEALTFVLEDLGHTVSVAHTGEQALAMSRTTPPEVVLCDLGLPDMDGLAVARALRASPGGERLRLIAVSGRGGAAEAANCRDAGFDRHLVKPVRCAELAAAIDDGGCDGRGAQ